MKKRKRIIIILALAVLSCVSFLLGCSGCESGKTPQTQSELVLLVDEYKIEVGATQKILATYGEEDIVTYVSENTEIATVDPNGKITGVSQGVTYINVNGENSSMSCKVTVTQSEYAVVIGYENINLVVGSNFNFDAQLLKNGEVYEGSVDWSVSTPDKCTFEATGNSATFTATQTGSFTVTATSDKASAACNIKVVSVAAKKIDAPVATIEHCDTLQWTAVTGAKSYAISVNGAAWTEVTTTEYSVAELSNVLLDGEKISFKIKGLAKDDYGYIDSYINSVEVAHSYEVEELTEVSCTQSGVGKFTCTDCQRTYTDEEYLRPHVFDQNVCTVCLQERTPVLLYLYDEDRDCYYVAGVKDTSVSVVYVSGYYDDGLHGKKEVMYIGESAFYTNQEITHLILPETVKILYEHCFHAMQSLEYISMPGVTKVAEYYDDNAPVKPASLTKIVAEGKTQSAFDKLTTAQKERAAADYAEIGDIEEYDSWTVEQLAAVSELYSRLRVERSTGMNQFQNVFTLKTIIISKDLVLSTQVFAHNKTEREPIASLYVLEKGGTITTGGSNTNLIIKDENGKMKQTFYDANGRCGTWHYAEDGYTVVETDPTHLFDENGVCFKCGAIDTQGINYDYDTEKDCYYVSGVQSGYEFEANAKGEVVVNILAAYDDGTHGTKSVSYLGKACFFENTAITHLILPESVTLLMNNCCARMTNLKYVAMPGVTSVTDSTNINQFMRCPNLETVIIKKDFTINGQCFFDDRAAYADSKDMIQIYALEADGEISIYSIAERNEYFKSNVALIYSENAACDNVNWKYAEDGYTVVVPQHEYDENDLCRYCGYEKPAVYNTMGVTYTYDADTQAYWVTDIADAEDESYLEVNGDDKILRILAEYNDGTNGKAPVIGVRAQALRSTASGATNRLARIVTHLILPSTVTTLETTCFGNMVALKYVSMVGVTSSTASAPFQNNKTITQMVVNPNLRATADLGIQNSTTVTIYTEETAGTDEYVGISNNSTLVLTNTWEKPVVTPLVKGVDWNYAADGYTIELIES